jgi:ABC-type uncharacterized transport system substrate-binding protein
METRQLKFITTGDIKNHRVNLYDVTFYYAYDYSGTYRITFKGKIETSWHFKNAEDRNDALLKVDAACGAQNVSTITSL